MIWTTPNGWGLRQGSGEEGFSGLKEYDWYVYTPAVGDEYRMGRLWVGKNGVPRSGPLPSCWMLP